MIANVCDWFHLRKLSNIFLKKNTGLIVNNSALHIIKYKNIIDDPAPDTNSRTGI